MRSTLACVCAVGAATLMLMAVPSAAQEPSLDRVLERAAAYVRQLHTQLASIVAEETYVQEVRTTLDSSIRPFSTPRRALRSDLLLVKPVRENRYVEYRDVFEVDGAPVRDREERLTALFLTHGETSRRRLRAIIEESARHNIGDIPRTINTPMLTLSFLLSELQPRFRFRKEGGAEPQLNANALSQGDAPAKFRVTTEMWTIAFREVRRPTVIRTNLGRDFSSAGRFWVNPETGAVLISELQLDSQPVRATINVSYQTEPLLGFLVPAEMREHYESRGVSVDGRATYGRFRQFQVNTREVIGRPPGIER